MYLFHRKYVENYVGNVYNYQYITRNSVQIENISIEEKGFVKNYVEGTGKMVIKL